MPSSEDSETAARPGQPQKKAGNEFPKYCEYYCKLTLNTYEAETYVSVASFTINNKTAEAETLKKYLAKAISECREETRKMAKPYSEPVVKCSQEKP